MLVSILFILVIGLFIFLSVLCEEIKYEKNINRDYVSDILTKSNIILKKEQIILYKDQTIDSYKKEFVELTEQIKTQKHAIILYERELKDYRTTKNCTSKLNLKS